MTMTKAELTEIRVLHTLMINEHDGFLAIQRFKNLNDALYPKLLEILSLAERELETEKDS